jgi:uncharacterized membrane protein YjgN (DUF898 family)
MSSIATPAKSGSPVYTGRIGEVARLAFGIGLLNVITLSFYRFWGTTRLRRYLWSRVSYDGAPLEYVGRGSELFVGFLIAIAILIPILVVYSVLAVFLASLDSGMQAAMQVVQLLVLYYLIYVALYRARRYRLTRTLWRGIRCGQTGSSLGYAMRGTLYGLLSLVSLGLAIPFQNVRLYRFRMNNTWYGSQDFHCEAKSGPLFKHWLVAWLLFIPTLGLIWVWYKARETRYLVGATTFQAVRFSSTLTGGQVFKLFLIYMLIFIGVTAVFIGIATAVAIATAVFVGLGEDPTTAMAELLANPALVVGVLVWYVLYFVVMSTLQATFFLNRMIAMLCRNLVIEGEPDYAALRQSDRAVPGFGEGLADALGTGGI